MDPAAQSNPAGDAFPPLLALPDSVLALVASRLPSPDKKAARLVCRALRGSVNAAVASLLITDANLPLLAPPDPKASQQLDQSSATQQLAHQAGHSHYHQLLQHQQQHQQQGASRRGLPLHLTFPNLTHLCLALSPSAGPETRRAEQLRLLLRLSLPALRCLRCLDLSLACRDVVLGRTEADVYDSWATIVEGLPAGRRVQVLLHTPAALAGGGPGGGSHCAAAAVAAAAANDFLRRGGSVNAIGHDGAGAGGGGGHGRGAGGDGDGGGGNGGGGRGACLLASMLALLGARRPAAEVRLVTAPLASKRYDKPRIPSHGELMAALSPPVGGGGGGGGDATAAAARCPAVAGLVIGPESFDPGGEWSARAGPLAGEGGGGGVATSAAASGGGGGGGGMAWLPLLAAANARSGAALEDLTVWETWPLAALLAAPSPSSSPSPSSCLLGLRRLVLSDQQAVLDRDRLSADALSPLSALTRLTRLELASLAVNLVNASSSSSSAAAAAPGHRRRGGGGAASRGRSGALARGSKAAAAAGRALPFTPLPQVRHLSVYHALRIVWPADGGDGGGIVDCGGGAAAAAAAAPLAALFPGLRHLSSCVAHGSPGRPASERWGYLTSLGSSLTSLHLRAVAAEDLCLQGRSEALAALTRVTSLRLSAESGKVDGIRGLARTIACLGPGLVVLRLSRLATRGTDPRVAELALPHLTRLAFLGCSGELVAAFDGLALSAVRLRRLEVRECDTIRPGDLQWALERQMGLQQLIIQDCPGLLAAPRGSATRGSVAPAASLRASLRAALRLSVATTESAEARALRRSRRRAGAGAGGGGSSGEGGGGEEADVTGGVGAAMVGHGVSGVRTADDLEEL